MNTLQLQTILYRRASKWQVQATARELAEELGSSPQTVKQHLKKLISDKIIVKVIETPGSPNTFVLRPLPKEGTQKAEPAPNKTVPPKPQKKPQKASKAATLRQDTPAGLWWLKLSSDRRFDADDVKKTGGAYRDVTDPDVTILGPFNSEQQAEEYAQQQRLELID